MWEVLRAVELGESRLKCGAHNLMTEGESMDSVRVETRLELLYLMTEGESMDYRYRLVNSNVTIKECVTSVRVETRLRKERADANW
jgi:hypothetical protein